MRSYLGYCLLVVCSLFLTACGGGSDSPEPVAGTPAPVLTNFTVSVDLPAQLTTANIPSFSFVGKAHADALTTLSETNFAAVWLDDKGKIFERIDLTNWESKQDGTYTFTAGTRIRINAVLLIDPQGQPDFTLGEALPQGLYMVPLANERLALTLESSLTYYALAERVISDESWGVFTEAFTSGSSSKTLLSYLDLQVVSEDIRDTLFPKIGMESLTLKDLMSLSIVQSMTKGRIERFFTEQAALEADIQAILTDGFWKVAAFNDNNGSGLMTDVTKYDGDETSIREFRWNKSGNDDINLTEFFTYLSGSTSFGTEDIQGQILTSDGWIGLFNYLKVISATQTSALLTDAALTKDDDSGVILNASVYPLQDKKMHDFLSSKENHFITRYIQSDQTFSEGASGFYFTWRPQNETYLLCDNTNSQDTCQIAPWQSPETAYTALDDVITQLQNVGPDIEDVNGFKLSDNVIVEFIDDGFFTIRYWTNIAADKWTIQELGVWASTAFASKSLIRFEVPDIIKQLASDYPFNSVNLFLVEDRGFVNIGETLLGNTELHYSGFDNDALAQILAASSRDNLPAFDLCAFGNTSLANEDLFLNAVTECGGDERFTTTSVDGLIDKTLVHISEQGEISARRLLADNSWEYFVDTLLQPSSTRSWSLTDAGYLQFFENNNSPEDFIYWAMTAYDYTQQLLAIKTYEATPPDAIIDTLMRKEYAAGDLTSCSTLDSGWNTATTAPVTKRNLTDYQEQVNQCKVIWFERNPVFTEKLLIGQTGELSDDKALTFSSDSSRFLQLSDNFSGDFFLGKYVDTDGCGFDIDIRWKLESDGTLYYEAIDGSLNERIQLTDTDGLQLSIKAFNHQTRWQTDDSLLFAATEGEIWSDIVTLIPASSVPNVTPIEEPAPDPNAPPPDPNAPPPAGTILNDGQACAFPAP
ncbi:hydrogenase expression protein HypA [Photobacterium makurazakiensis]|uniref:hydrogenase expression protein HypA n=1 Tax=Photobacterium makurazakiensis TaxID=2910234 RepID=UPI003D0D89F8